MQHFCQMLGALPHHRFGFDSNIRRANAFSHTSQIEEATMEPEFDAEIGCFGAALYFGFARGRALGASRPMLRCGCLNCAPWLSSGTSLAHPVVHKKIFQGASLVRADVR